MIPAFKSLAYQLALQIKDTQSAEVLTTGKLQKVRDMPGVRDMPARTSHGLSV